MLLSELVIDAYQMQLKIISHDPNWNNKRMQQEPFTLCN